MGVVKSVFGSTKDKKIVDCYTLKNANGMEAEVITFGANLRTLKVADKNGKLLDIVHGFDKVCYYEDNNDTYYGATIGRCGNRIGKAKFTLNGVEYQLDVNDGNNNLHGGFNGYEKRVFDVVEVIDTDEPSVKFHLTSEDMDQGFPGELDFNVTYTLTKDNELKLYYEAVSDKDTIINPTNHTYFNLDGQESDSILDQEVQIFADTFTWADNESIPTGEIVDVTDTPMDFREFHAIGERIEADYEALKFGAGYDHNYCVNDTDTMKTVAKMRSVKSGILMEVSTDLPGMQLYVGNFIKGNQIGKDGKVYQRRSGACFETQYYPDAINHDNFKQPVFKAGEALKTTTVYKFSV